MVARLLSCLSAPFAPEHLVQPATYSQEQCHEATYCDKYALKLSLEEKVSEEALTCAQEGIASRGQYHKADFAESALRDDQI